MPACCLLACLLAYAVCVSLSQPPPARSRPFHTILPSLAYLVQSASVGFASTSVHASKRFALESPSTPNRRPPPFVPGQSNDPCPPHFGSKASGRVRFCARINQCLVPCGGGARTRPVGPLPSFCDEGRRQCGAGVPSRDGGDQSGSQAIGRDGGFASLVRTCSAVRIGGRFLDRMRRVACTRTIRTAVRRLPDEGF